MTDLTLNTAATPNVNATTCVEVANVLWSPKPYQDFESFQNTLAIRMAHSGVPRGGASNDILNLITGSSEQAQDYLVGLVVSSIIILVFFGSWIALLIVLRLCFGPSKVGWLSGRRQPLPKKPVEINIAAPQPPQDVEKVQNNKMQLYYQNQNQNPQDDLEQVGPKHDDQPAIDEHDDTVVAAAPPDTTFDNSNKDIADSKNPNAPNNQPLTVDQWNELYQQKMKQQFRLKAAVIFACLVVVTMAIIMATKGVQSLRGSLNYSQNSINYAQVLIDAAAQTVAGLGLFLRSFRADMQILLGGANAICPNVRPFLCENLSDVDTCNTTGVFGDTKAGQELGETFEQLVQVFYQDWNIVDKLRGFEQDLVDLSATASYAEDQISTFDWVFYIAILFDVMVGLLALAMIVFLVLPSCRHRWCLQCMHHRCLFPTFIVLVLLSLIFAIAFLIASLVSADTCANDPDQRFMAIATHFLLDDRQPYISEFIIYWLSRCNVPTRAIDQIESVLQDMYDYVVSFEDDVVAVNDWLVETCGTTNPGFLVNVAGSLLGYICVAVGIVWQVKDAFQCSTWLPIYYTTVYNALCYNGVGGVWAIAATQFLTCFMTCVILTCRCVFFDLRVEGEEEEEEDNDEKKHVIEEVVVLRDEAKYTEDEVANQVRIEEDEDENGNEKAEMNVEKVKAIGGGEEVQAVDDGAVQVIVEEEEEEDKKTQAKKEEVAAEEDEEIHQDDERADEISVGKVNVDHETEEKNIEKLVAEGYDDGHSENDNTEQVTVEEQEKKAEEINETMVTLQRVELHPEDERIEPVSVQEKQDDEIRNLKNDTLKAEGNKDVHQEKECEAQHVKIEKIEDVELEVKDGTQPSSVET